MADISGFLFAIVAAASFGTAFVPLKILKRPDVMDFQAIMSTGIFIVGAIATLLFSFPINFEVFTFVSGLFWVMGNYISAKAVETIGLAKGAAIWMSTIILLSFLVGIFAFQEQINFLYLGIIGVVSILFGVVAVSKSRTKEKLKNARRGIIFSVVAGIFFTFFGAILNLGIGNSSSESSLFPLSLGILVGSWLLLLVVKRSFSGRIWKHGLAAGGIWAAGGVGTIFALPSLGVAITGPLTQMALLFSVAWGVLYFREMREKKNMAMIGVGAFAMIVGMFLLMFSTI